jgi:hypothetical protein
VEQTIYHMPSKKKISDEDLEKELDKAFKEDEAKKDQCGKALPISKETGVQRDKVKVKKK